MAIKGEFTLVENSFSGISLKNGSLKKLQVLVKNEAPPTNRNCMVAELPGLNAYALREEQNG